MRTPLVLVVVASVLLAGCATPQADEDGDGLPKALEEQFGTDPQVADTDGDGLTDGQEVTDFSATGVDPLQADTDGDGLDDFEEVILYGTDPTRPDTDQDGLGDRREVEVFGVWQCPDESDKVPRCRLQEGADPLSGDTDDDRWSDGDEIQYWMERLDSRREARAFVGVANVDGDDWIDGLDAEPLHDVALRFDIPRIDLHENFTEGGGANISVAIDAASRSRTVDVGPIPHGTSQINVSWRVNVDDGPAIGQRLDANSAVSVTHHAPNGSRELVRITGNDTALIPAAVPLGDYTFDGRGPETTSGREADLTYAISVCRPAC